MSHERLSFWVFFVKTEYLLPQFGWMLYWRASSYHLFLRLWNPFLWWRHFQCLSPTFLYKTGPSVTVTSRSGFAVRKGWLTDCSYSVCYFCYSWVQVYEWTFWSPFLVPNTRESAEFGFFSHLMVGWQFWHRFIKCLKFSINRGSKGSLISACSLCNAKVVILTGLYACGIEHSSFPSCCYSWSSRLLILVHFRNNFVPVLFFFFILFPFLLGPSNQIPHSALLNKFLLGNRKIKEESLNRRI